MIDSRVAVMAKTRELYDHSNAAGYTIRQTEIISCILEVFKNPNLPTLKHKWKIYSAIHSLRR